MKAFLTIICISLIYFILPAGCSKEKPAVEPCNIQLNLNAPELDGQNVTVNGGVIAPVKQIQWNWGDGTIDKHRYFPARHTYAGPGRYEIKTTAFSIKGCSEEKTLVVNVK
ncbi:MAG: PKD domain-containing protein [Deltaproteobacteria bacterium]|nr:PKD domain-containing protein [Deltaproteobacteria bacterium]